VVPCSRIVGYESGKRRLVAFDELRQPPVVDTPAAFGHILEQPDDGLRQGGTASRFQVYTDLGHRPALLHGGEELARIELPHEIRDTDRVGAERQAVPSSRPSPIAAISRFGRTRNTGLTSMGAAV